MLLCRDIHALIVTDKAIWETSEGIMIRVLVKPRSRTIRLIEEISEAGVLVNLKEPAREGKANSELVKRLAKALSVSSSDVAIVAGYGTREKIVRIRGQSQAEVQELLLKATRSQ
ncbi:MAG: hypothetical protein C4K49_12940 [Candidatus Thorarchaeota archaeon]|nr:MAG: hypothetical protein C4K49_12940 [Candidatus Thorarchaeota archaeon]